MGKKRLLDTGSQRGMGPLTDPFPELGMGLAQYFEMTHNELRQVWQILAPMEVATSFQGIMVQVQSTLTEVRNNESR